MSKLVPYFNGGTYAVTIGTVCIQPGETRPVDADHLPDAGEVPAETSAPSDERPVQLIPLLDGNVSALIAALPTLSLEDLEALDALEALSKNRVTAKNAITEERLKRAAALRPAHLVPLLDGPSDDLIAALPNLTTEDLGNIAAFDYRGDVLAALEVELLKRKAAAAA